MESYDLRNDGEVGLNKWGGCTSPRPPNNRRLAESGLRQQVATLSGAERCPVGSNPTPSAKYIEQLIR